IAGLGAIFQARIESKATTLLSSSGVPAPRATTIAHAIATQQGGGGRGNAAVAHAAQLAFISAFNEILLVAGVIAATGAIRESADNRFIGHLGEAKRLKKEKPDRVVGVGGCWSQSLKDEVFERFPFVDVAFGPGQIPKLAEYLLSDSLSAQMGYFDFESVSG